MSVAARDVIPLSQARANLSEIFDEVKAGAEKIITKNGESYVAIIDAHKLDHYHALEQEQIHLMLLDDIEQGLEDVATGQTEDARVVLAKIRKQRQG